MFPSGAIFRGAIKSPCPRSGHESRGARPETVWPRVPEARPGANSRSIPGAAIAAPTRSSEQTVALATLTCALHVRSDSIRLVVDERFSTGCQVGRALARCLLCAPEH